MDKEQNGKKKGSRIPIYIFLHLFLMIYSFSSIFSKKAADKDFLSLPFCIFYGLSLFVLFVYAIGWQQFIKRLPLTEAYANRAVSVIWGCIWGVFLFNEKLSFRNIIGALLVIAGVILFSVADGESGVEADAESVTAAGGDAGMIPDGERAPDREASDER